MYIQARDGRFYQNPCIFGTDWYLWFESDPEVVIRRFPRSSLVSCRARAGKVMREAGVEAGPVARGAEAVRRSFPPLWDGLYDAYAYEVTLRNTIPIPSKFDSVVDDVGAVWDHHVVGFYSDVSAADCAKIVVGLDIDLMIARALLSQPFYKKAQERVRPEICKKLYAQYPWLKGLRRGTWETQLLEKPSMLRVRWRGHVEA